MLSAVKCALALCLSSGVHCQCWSFFCCCSSRRRLFSGAPVDPMLSRATPEPKQRIYLFHGPVRAITTDHNTDTQLNTKIPMSAVSSRLLGRPFCLLQTGRVIRFCQIGVKTNSRAMNSMRVCCWNSYSHTLGALWWKSNPVWTLGCVFMSHGT